MQDSRPLTYTSKTLSLSHQNMSTYDKEMLAIVHAATRWRPYLIGRRFQIKTDHKSLKYFLEQKISSPEQQKWVTKLLGFDYEITYKKGKENVLGDGPKPPTKYDYPRRASDSTKCHYWSTDYDSTTTIHYWIANTVGKPTNRRCHFGVLWWLEDQIPKIHESLASRTRLIWRGRVC